METYGEPLCVTELLQADWEEAVEIKGEVLDVSPLLLGRILGRMREAAAKIGADPHYQPCAELPMRAYALEETLDGFAYAVGEEIQEETNTTFPARWATLLNDLAGVKRRPRVYVAGPYTAPTVEQRRENIQAADDASAHLLTLGYAPFNPIGMTANFDDRYPEVDKDLYLQTGLDWLPFCDAILLLPGWERSAGACEEHRRAVHCGLEVFWELRDVPPAAEFWANRE